VLTPEVKIKRLRKQIRELKFELNNTRNSRIQLQVLAEKRRKVLEEVLIAIAKHQASINPKWVVEQIAPVL